MQHCHWSILNLARAQSKNAAISLVSSKTVTLQWDVGIKASCLTINLIELIDNFYNYVYHIHWSILRHQL